MWIDAEATTPALSSRPRLDKKGDQIEVFKILNGYESIDRNIFLT